MNAADWAKLKTWFGLAIDAPPDALSDILRDAEHESPELAAELRALLREHELRDLRTSAVMAQASTAVEAHPPDGPAGGEVGPYRVLRELGRGGTGIVFLAERIDDEFHRLVALKVLRYVAWDRRSREMLTSERRVLSQLQHPNIAALLDWGTTPEGAPWLATEYVEGEPIDQYCRARHLSVADTLVVFEQVCEAVQYAHRRLVVHRDLKPANVLVTDAGLVKLLDFGISKPMNEASATATTERRFTPAYASPEQIKGGIITAATDVHALGLMLYELLTGVLPYASASLEDLSRRLEDKPVPLPSHAPGLSRDRQRAIRGDLDRIVLHALEREPERRYPSVEQFLGDVERHRAGFPITAERPSSVERAMKFARRHSVPVALALLAAAALVIGTSVAIAKARAAERERQIAQQRFDDVKNLAHWVIFDAHDMIRLVPGPGSVEVRRQLLAKAVEYLDRLNADRSNDDSLRKEVAQAYIRVAYSQGGLAGTNLGQTTASIKNYRAALQILDDLWPRHPDDEWIGAARFAAAYNLAMMLNDPADGVDLAKRYAVDVDAWIARDRDSPPLQAAELVHAALGRTLRATGALDAALGQFDISIDASHKALPFTHTDNAPRPMFGTWLDRSQNYFDTGLAAFARAETLLEMGRVDDAVAGAEEARQLFARSMAEGKGGPSDLRMFARSHGQVAQTLWELRQPGKLEEALSEARIEMTAAVSNTNDGSATAQRDLAEAHRHMGNILVSSGDVSGGLAHLQTAVSVIDNAAKADPAFLMNRYLLMAALNDEGSALLKARQADAALPVFRRALETANAGMTEAPSWVELLRERARAESGVGRASFGRGGSPVSDILREGLADWHELRRRSPLNRRYLGEQEAVEDLLATRSR